jgi:hypothetical protein
MRQVAGWEAVRPLWWKLSDALFARDEPTPLPLLSVDLLPAAQPPAAAPEDTFHWQYRERPQGVDSRRQPNLVARLRRRRMAPQGQVRCRWSTPCAACGKSRWCATLVRVVGVLNAGPSSRKSVV